MDERWPRAGVDYPGTWQAFEAWFADDRACQDYLAGVREDVPLFVELGW